MAKCPLGKMVLLLALILINSQYVVGFLIPGVAPTEYADCEKVPVLGVKLTSSRTQLPYEYYSMPFCKPKGDLLYTTENLGEVLRGDRIVNTPYDFKVKQNVHCQQLCEPIKLNIDQQKLLSSRIRQEYYVHLITDNLPVAYASQKSDNSIHYEVGYRLGHFDKEAGKTYLNNHLEFTMKYHEFDSSFRVVGFEVRPASLAMSHFNAKKDEKLHCGEVQNQCEILQTEQWQFLEIPFKAEKELEVKFTYSIAWVPSELKWASRWDTYLSMSNAQIHWFSILNSMVVVFFLAGVLTAIIVRTLKKDIATYNRDEEDLEEALEESGWKLVHGDVFRAPRHSMLLSTLVGTGVQLIGLTSVLIVFAALGMLSPASRGALMTAAILVYVFMGIMAGFYAGRLYKTLKGIMWKRASLLTSIYFPGIILGCGFLMNFFIWGKKSSGAIPFTTMIALLALWFGVSVPLVFLGYYFGYRKQPYDHPVRTNQIPRQVPEQQWYLHPIPAALLAGILPFGAMFIELFFIFSALWQNQFYYLFGFLFLVYGILLIACSQISIVMVYFQLCAEDYHWWWRSFIVSGGSAIYLFAYSTFYFFNRLDIVGFIPTLLYFVYSFLMAFSFWILTGTIGFYAAYLFIRKIYGAIKID